MPERDANQLAADAAERIKQSWFAPIWHEDGYASCLACGNRYGHDDDCVIGKAAPALDELMALVGTLQAGDTRRLTDSEIAYQQSLLIRIGELEALAGTLQQQRDAAQREADIQMGEKLAAQVTLKAITDALDLPFAQLGNGWTDSTAKIIARIEEIVDEGERGFRERDEAIEALDELSPFPRETVFAWKRRAEGAEALIRYARLLLNPDRTDEPDEENALRAFEALGGAL